MAITSYTKAYPNGWENLPSNATPFTATAMNTIEGGIAENRDLLIVNEQNFVSATPSGATTLSLLKGMEANTERHYYTNTALSDFPTTENNLWFLQLYRVNNSNIAYSDIILRNKTTGKNYVGTASNNNIVWHEVGSGEGNAILVELTKAEYDALPTSEKNNGTLYVITDANTPLPTTMAASNVSFNHSSTSLNGTNVQTALAETSHSLDMLGKVEKTGKATEPYVAGQYLVSGNNFRKVSSAIANGNTISNSNSTATTVGEEIYRLNTNLSEKIKAGKTTVSFTNSQGVLHHNCGFDDTNYSFLFQPTIGRLAVSSSNVDGNTTNIVLLNYSYDTQSRGYLASFSGNVDVVWIAIKH